MKKLLLLIVSVAVAMSVSAGVKSNGNAYRPLEKPAHASLRAPSHVDIITEQPEGTVVNYTRGGEFLVVSMYGYETNAQTGQLKVVFAEDGKTVYMKDPLAYGEGVGAWVYGTLNDDGTLITVPLGQYVSYNEEYGYGLILSWGSTEVYNVGTEDDPFYWLDFYADESVTEVTYRIDPETRTITLVGGEGDMTNPEPFNYMATGIAGVWDDDGSLATIEWKTEWTMMDESLPAVPANPELVNFFDSGTEEGYTRIDFDIKLVDVEDKPLNSDYVTYSIYTDEDELFTFDYDTYGPKNGFDTDVTEIPYGYSGYDFYLRRVYFYRTNMGDNPMFTWRIGIQVHYTVNGVRNSSDIAYLEVYPRPSVVNELDVTKPVSSVRYYNMAGQELSQPSGLTIEVTTYSDGTTNAVKLIK